MAFPHASFETYTALRDMDITHPDITHEGVVREWRLGQTASWARWGANTSDLAPITAHSQEEFDQLKPFTTRVILFAINMGGTALKLDLEDWRNFHTKGHSPDGTLKNSVAMAWKETSASDQIPALYMTDVFKLIPTPDGRELEDQIRADLEQGIDHVERCAEILRKELKLCLDGSGGQAPTLVGMGDWAFDWLTGAKKDQRIARVVDEVLGDGASQRVRKMPHYSFTSTNEGRAAALCPVLEGILLEQQEAPAAV